MASLSQSYRLLKNLLALTEKLEGSLQRMSSLRHFLLLLIVVAAGLSGCGPAPTPIIRDQAPSLAEPSEEEAPQEEETGPRLQIRIALLLPLSGPDSEIGQALLNAANMALFDSGDKRLVLLPADTRGTVPGAEAAMREVLSARADIVLGPLFADNVRAIKPLAQEAGIKIIAFSTDHTVSGDGAYLLNFRPAEQVKRILTYAAEQGHDSFAALIPETAYGERVLEIFGKTLLRLHRDMTAVQTYKPMANELFDPVKTLANYDRRRREYLNEVDFLESLGDDDDFAHDLMEDIKHLETLGEVDFDAILVPEGGALLRTLAPLLPYYEIDPAKVKFLGTGLWDDAMLRHEPPLIGGWYAAPEKGTSDRFFKRYEKTYGLTAPRLATLGYDAVALAATMVRQTPVPDFSDERLTDPAGFIGIDGLFRFRTDGSCERGLAVYEITTGVFREISPAPTSFIPPSRVPLTDSEVDKIFYGLVRQGARPEGNSAGALPSLLPEDAPRPYQDIPEQEELPGGFDPDDLPTDLQSAPETLPEQFPGSAEDPS
ncbi:penicillin-binding protein activator [Emcibacter nanhaiensis]|uniref:Penicillin-binding protein activator n=1 Tax=Emcibacter nanhaiensis TaxID=1505037 RepID=A0A501PIN1_9PROT|nr:penicillin-binding protein activator [Emcibacter nanhaiensis]